MTLAPRLLPLALAACACEPLDQGVPLDDPIFPTGLALAGDRLLVVSSDFELAAGEGAVLSADLAAVRERVDDEGAQQVVEGAYTSGVVVPSFGDRIVVVPGGDRAYVSTRRTNVVVALDVAADGTLSCPDENTVIDEVGDGAPRCGQASSGIQLAAPDPFDIVLLDVEGEGEERRVEGAITLQSSRSIVFFSDDASRPQARRLQVDGTLDLAEAIGGIRSAVLRPEVAGTDPVLIAAADLSRDLELTGAVLLVLEPGDETSVEDFDVTAATGSLALRDILLVPGDDGEDDALIAVLRAPDALARFEIDDVGGVPELRLVGVEPTCFGPPGLARARVPIDGETVDRVLVTCHDGDTIEAVDPLTLLSTDAVRFFGRGPYDVVVDESRVADGGDVDVYVSFHLDGSIGALRFVNGRLEPTGRIGAADPRPEDGRE